MTYVVSLCLHILDNPWINHDLVSEIAATNRLNYGTICLIICLLVSNQSVCQ
jgi:hypothetical protein